MIHSVIVASQDETFGERKLTNLQGIAVKAADLVAALKVDAWRQAGFDE